MKPNIYKLTSLLLVFVWQVSLANDIEKQKVINKSHQVNKDVKLQILNKFGKVHVDTWNETQMSIKVTIIARANNNEKVQELLKKVTIDIDKNTKNLITYETLINTEGSHKSKIKESYEIHYFIKMPKQNPLTIKNTFGDIYIDNFEGPLTLNLSYGNLKMESVDNTSEIKLAFSNGKIKSLKKGELTVKYSSLEIGTVENVTLINKFSDITIDKSAELEMISKYGDIKIAEVDDFEGKVSYSDFNIQKLNKTLILDVNYGNGINIDKIDKNFNHIEIEGGFSPLMLNFEKEISALLEAELEFCDLEFDEKEIEFIRQMPNQHLKIYKGKIGNDTNKKVIINSKYGNVKVHVLK